MDDVLAIEDMAFTAFEKDTAAPADFWIQKLLDEGVVNALSLAWKLNGVKIFLFIYQVLRVINEIPVELLLDPYHLFSIFLHIRIMFGRILI